MIKLDGTDVGIVCGMRGTGKSHFLRKAVRATARYVLWDPLQEHSSLGAVVRTAAQLKVALSKNPRIVVQGYRRNISEFEQVAACVYAWGNRFLFVDEADQVMPSRAIGPAAKELVDLGRHRNIGLLCVTRRIADLDKCPVAQANKLFIFKTTLPQDIEYLRGFVAEAPQAKLLEGHRFLYVDNGRVVEHEKI